MATWAGKVAVFCGLLLIGCGGKSSDGEGAGGSAGQAGGGAQGGGVSQGGSTPSGQGGSQPGGGSMATGGGPAYGGSGAQSGSGGGAPECFPGDENTCDCGGFSSCQPDGTWSPCDCPPGACDNDPTQLRADYGVCAREECIGDLGSQTFAPCVQRCAQDSWGVSPGCSACMATLVECAATTCISKCLSDQDGSCDACLCEQGCMQRARACAGSNTDLPLCADGS